MEEVISKEVEKINMKSCRSCHHSYSPDEIKYHTCTPCLSCRLYGVTICKRSRPTLLVIKVRV